MGYYPFSKFESQYSRLYCGTQQAQLYCGTKQAEQAHSRPSRHTAGQAGTQAWVRQEGGETRSGTATIRSVVCTTRPRRPTTRRAAACTGARQHSAWHSTLHDLRHGRCALRHGREEGHDTAKGGLRHGTWCATTRPT